MIDIHDSGVRERILDEVPVELRGTPILIGGSLVQGYGNATSDIDLIALVDDPASIPPATQHTFTQSPGVTIRIGYVDQWRIDLEVVETEVLRELGAKLAAGSADANLGLDVPYLLRTTLHNINIGIPLVGAARIEEIRSRFPWPRWCTFLGRRAEHEFRSRAEDAAGAIGAADAWNALYSSREAMHLAIDALTALRGNTNASAKWRHRKLRDLGDDALTSRFWELSLDVDGSIDGVLRRAKERLVFAQEVVMLAALPPMAELG